MDLQLRIFGGGGFKDIYIRVDEPKKLSEKRIGINDIEQILAKSEFSRVDNVTTGYGSSYREVCNNTIGYGRRDCAILYDCRWTMTLLNKNENKCEF